MAGELLPGMGKLHVGMCQCYRAACLEVLLEHGSLVPPLPNDSLLGLGGKENQKGLQSIKMAQSKPTARLCLKNHPRSWEGSRGRRRVVLLDVSLAQKKGGCDGCHQVASSGEDEQGPAAC